jgi:phenylacetate-CoA ligase
MQLNGIVAVTAGAGNTELQVNMIRDLGIKGYVGTPTFLMNLLQKAGELGYDFHQEFKLRCAVVWGEPLLPEVRNTIEQDYSITLRDGIGVGTGLIFGCECSQKAGFHITEEQFIEIVDPDTRKQLEPGEVGAVVVTAFHNNAFPNIRYMTGDLSALANEPCPCGRTSPRLMGVMGRVGDSVKVRALYLTPGQVETVASRFPVISKFQVVVSRVGYKDEMTFNLELADETIDRDEFFRELQTTFQGACRLKIDKINFVPPGTIPEEHKTIVDERSWKVKR